MVYTMKAIAKIGYLLFVALLIAVAGVFLASLLPIPGNIEIKIVKSGSMEPSIKTGSLVVVKSFPIDTYKVGDVITFGEDNSRQIPTTHRIFSINADRTAFMTKGDANEEEDPQEVPISKVIGKVVFHVPYAGYILDFARTPLGFTFLIGVPAGVIILDEIARIFGEVVAIRRRKRLEIKDTSSENNE